MQRIGIIGGGGWGTALAVVGRRAGLDVVLWAREPETVAAINRRHENTGFLPGFKLDPKIRATGELAEACSADLALLAVPAQHLRAVAAAAARVWQPGVAAVLCAKGIEEASGLLLHEVATEVLPGVTVGLLSGPSFAAEVARGLPTAVSFASADPKLRTAVPAALATPEFRIYGTDDLVGTGIGGAVKNVLAIACGIVEGRGLGDNARAALITRGLAEITRLAEAKGGRARTLMGLGGLGDLVLTCTAMQSRNYSLGVELGHGAGLGEVLANRSGVTEGVSSASAVSLLARRLAVELPICSAVDAVLHRGADIDAVIAGLLARPPREEVLAAASQPA
jgi:glycerol-3-phosphate dehydrogenase (NAD(P)+)